MSVLISDNIDILLENIDNYKISILCGKRIREYSKKMLYEMFTTKVKTGRLMIIQQDLHRIHHSIFPLRYDNYTIIIEPDCIDIHVKILNIINAVKLHDKKAVIIINNWMKVRNRELKYILKPSNYAVFSHDNGFEMKNLDINRKIIHVNK